MGWPTIQHILARYKVPVQDHSCHEVEIIYNNDCTEMCGLGITFDLFI